ncbi:MAG: beta-lactamase family protein [Sphingobacteriia bacterium]|nr:beta-lactamase family protein [Sphingobacteriia bacterium]
MKFFSIKLIILIKIFFISLPGFADNNLRNLPHLENFIKTLENDQKGLQGGAIAILYKGNVIYKNTFGYCHERETLITSKTLFPLASVSKTVAATAIALLDDRNEIDIEKNYLLSFLHHKVNLKNILNHTTGYLLTGNRQIEDGMERGQILKKIIQQKPACKPNNCYFYSNILFSTAEEILNINNTNLANAISQLSSVLNLKELQVLPIKPDSNIAYPHIEKKNIIKALPFPPYYPKAAPASAGVFASIDNMIELLKLQSGYRPDLISQETLNKLFTPYIINDDLKKFPLTWPIPLTEIDSYYGLGWRILKAKPYPNKDLIFHSGYINGIVSFVGFIPSEETGIIILLNQTSKFAFQKGIDFWKVFLK